MSETQSELKAAPQIVEALYDHTNPIECLELWEWTEEDEDERVTVWAEQIEHQRFRIMSPVWNLKHFRYGDIVSTNTEYSSGETFESVEEIVTPSDWVTMAILPNSPVADADDVFNALNAVLGETEWICEVLEAALLIVILSKEDHAKYAQALDDVLEDKGLVQRPGPWCTRFLEAIKTGDRATALAEFLVGNGDEDDEGSNEEVDLREESMAIAA
jgi:hypothetical protein